jgi:1,2-diacylglycerol 3-beta-glucosyltransferase
MMAQALAIALVAVLTTVWALLTAGVLYLLLLASAAMVPYRRVGATSRERSFRLVIPAHNEELVLEPVLRRVTSLRYPRDKYDVIVIADNCTDRTAEIARAAGARVFERIDPVVRGKGHALTHAFNALAQESFDAYVVIDADTMVDHELLAQMNRYLEAEHRVIQAHYDVLNPFENRRTALMYVAFSIFNYVRPLGRRVLGLSTGLKGNGMCFDKTVIARYPWDAFTLAEDIEYTTTLLQNGESITFAPEARVWAQMPTSRAQAKSQRIRWEAGRMQLARRDGPRLIWQGLARRDRHLFDWGIDLLIPPIVMLGLAVFAGTGLAGLLAAVVADWAATILFGAWLVLLAALGLFVLIAMLAARLPRQAYAALLSAPGYIVWKLWIYAIMIVRRAPAQWVRTDRSHIP